MPAITLKHYPPENEQDFERLCLLLLREHWSCPDLQMYGRRGQSQDGVDIVDLGGDISPRAAQCKNFNPLEALSPNDVSAAVEEAKKFRPALRRFEIMTTAKKSKTTQLALLNINREHREQGLFRVRLKTWDEIELLLGNYPAASEQVYGAGLGTVISELRDEVRSAASQFALLSPPTPTGPSGLPPPQFNRVLVRWKNKFVKRLDGDRVQSFFQDYSALLLTIEELVSLGALKLALDFAPGEFPSLLERLPDPLRNRVVFVGDRALRATVETILSPIYEEFGVESMDGGCSLKFNTSSESKTHECIVVTWITLYDFLLGVKNRLQIDIDIGMFLFAVQQLRHRSRNPTSRAHLAVIEGILRSYEARTIDSVGLRPTATAEAITLFNQFAGLETYRKLSEAALSIGSPARLLDATENFSSLSRSLVFSPELAQSLELRPKRIIASGLIPQQDVLRAVRPDPESFLSPIISFAAARAKAAEAYERIKPDPLVHDFVKRPLEE